MAGALMIALETFVVMCGLTTVKKEIESNFFASCREKGDGSVRLFSIKCCGPWHGSHTDAIVLSHMLEKMH